MILRLLFRANLIFTVSLSVKECIISARNFDAEYLTTIYRELEYTVFRCIYIPNGSFS